MRQRASTIMIALAISFVSLTDMACSGRVSCEHEHESPSLVFAEEA